MKHERAIVILQTAINELVLYGVIRWDTEKKLAFLCKNYIQSLKEDWRIENLNLSGG